MAVLDVTISGHVHKDSSQILQQKLIFLWKKTIAILAIDVRK
jgi:hypothetical protein